VLIGHSVGEYVAACLAGVLSLEDATRLVAARGRLMQSLPAGGAMAAIFAPEDRVAAAVAPHETRVSIAAVNGPEQTVVSGAAADVEAIGRAFAAQGVRVQALPVSHAFHSPLVDPILDAFEREAAQVRFAPPRLPLISNVTGKPADAAEVTRPGYWRRHVREAVRFGDGLRALMALRPEVAVEIGPHPTLIAFAKGALGASAPLLIPTLRKGRPEWEQMLETAAGLYLGGAEIDWRGLGSGRIVDLPTYPFQRERYWFQAKPRPNARTRAGHPLAGARLRSAGAETIYESSVSADAPAFVRQHRVQGQVIMPATAYLEALAAVGHEVLDADAVSVEEVTVKEAMLLDDDGAGRTMQVVCGPVDPKDGAVPVTLSSLADGAGRSAFSAGAADGPWIEHVTARLRPAAAPPAAASLSDLRARCAAGGDAGEHYASFERRGLDFGPGFKVVRQLARGEREALGVVELAPEFAREAGAYRMHPVLLDGCLQVLAAALPSDADVLYLPVGFGAYTRHRSPGARCLAHVTVQAGSGEAVRADVRVLDDEGRVVAELREAQLKRVSRDALAHLGERWLDESLFETTWRPAPIEPAAVALAPADLAAAGQKAVPALKQAAAIDSYDAFLPRLEAMCADYVVRAMKRLGWTPAAGEPVDESALADRLRVAARHRRLFGRFLGILSEGPAEARWLERGPQGFTVARAFGDVDPERELGRLTAELPAGAPELEMTGRAAGEMAEALRGERDPMQLLFPGGSLATAERLYRDTPTARFYNGLMAEVMEALAAARKGTAGRPLRVLEIGAGTGGTTSHVVPRLPTEGVEYTFTDVGPLFVERARERFAAHPFLRYAVLDLERDPEAQGFTPGSFDVVIASNVIHATAVLRTTLARVRRLLAPGGLLAMLEVTAPQRWFDLTVGLTEGWWAFADPDLRSDYATMPRQRWLDLLSACGFDAAAALPEGTGHAGCLGLQSLLLARAGAGAGRDWLIVADRGGTAAALAAKLQARGERCLLVEAGTDFGRLLGELRAAGRTLHGAVFAAALDGPDWENAAAGDLDRGTVSALSLAQALLGESPPPRLWILTRGGKQADALDRALDPAQAPLWGLGKTLGREHAEQRCVCVDLDPEANPADVEALAAELEAPGTEPQVAIRAGARRVARLVRTRRARPPAAVRVPWRLSPAARGSLDGLAPAPFDRRAPGPGQVEIAVEATGLNFKDVLNVLGMYPGEPGPLGGECAGKVTAVGAGVTHLSPGDDVLALGGGSFSSHLLTRAEYVQKRPPGVTAEEGASFPIAFLTAEFCLGHLAGMRAGERVLVHGAAGGVGMAAVRLAQRAGVEVFATAGAPWKRELLRAMGVAHVFDSRSPAFADEILARTGGEGVHVVLNSLSGDTIDASFRVLARGGRFVEIGKRGIKTPEEVTALGRDHRYFIVDWGETGERDPALIGGMLARLTEDLGQGTLAPLPRHVFGLDEASRAFRFMAQARHAGKIVVRNGAGAGAGATSTVRRDGTYLVTGGLAGLGPLVGRWLVERGAGRVVLIGRRQVTPEVEALLAPLRGRGTMVEAASVDVTDGSALRALIERLRRDGPPLRGIVHSAGVLADAGFLQQDAARFAHVLAPKVRGGWLLDSLTRTDPLDFFVLFSSVAAVLGSPGQANHSAANAFLDLLARERRSRGVHGLSINWGPWTEVGAAADRGITDKLAAQGLGALTPEQGLRAFERLLAEPGAQVAVVPIDWRRFLAHSAGGKVPAFFTELAGLEAAAAPTAKAAVAAAPVELRAELEAAPQGRRRPMVAAFVRERALRALGVDPSRAVDPQTPLGEMGLDSLLAVELRNTLATALGRPMPATLLFDYPTIDALTDHILTGVLGLGGDAPGNGAAPAAPAPSTLVGSIEDLSDEEVDRQLAARRQAQGLT
jgi:acyl transferase domain-containing protein